MTDKEKIQKMRGGDTIFIKECPAQILNYNEMYYLSKISLYGGDPCFMGVYKNIDKMIKEYQSWR